MPRYENAELTVMCMVQDGDSVLVQDRRKSDWPGLTFPGGHVERGESFSDAAVREVYEETGLTIFNPRLCGVKQFETDDAVRYIVFLFKTNEFSGTLNPSDEGEVFFMPINDLKLRDTAHDFLSMLRLFEDDELSELYYFKDDSGEWQKIIR